MCEMLERKQKLKYVTFENLVFRKHITALPESMYIIKSKKKSQIIVFSKRKRYNYDK